MTRWLTITATALLALDAGATVADEAGPKPVPVTRPEMKQALEDLKRREPRLPLPPLTAEQVASGRVPVNNGRMRAQHLPSDLHDGGGFLRGGDSDMTLDPTFKTLLFWVVSRVNNCHYCLGHQERKLASAGLTDDRLAALDCDWSAFTPAERAAFAFTRKLTYEPHALSAADLDALLAHYTEVEALEIVLAVAGFNAMNRWTDALGIPQEDSGAALLRGSGGQAPANIKTFLTPTSAAFRDRPSIIAPTGEGTPGRPTAALAKRPPLESRAEVEQKLAELGRRPPRLKPADEAATRAALPATWPAEPIPNWVRLLARFPKSGIGRAVSLRTAQDKGVLTAALKAQIAWIAARHDRAWYALGQAQRQLRALGYSDHAIFAIDWAGASLS